MEYELGFLIILPIVAFLYAAVGHGGASGYLALMSLFSFPITVMKPTALLLNLFVAGISFIHFFTRGFFNGKLFLTFAIGSIPMSYLGGTIVIETMIYKIVLGICLLFAVLKMLDVFGKSEEKKVPINWAIGLGFGSAIGFVSGLIGIGGGIILSPVILLLNWGNVKEAAAVSALFIWVNSLAGLIGQLSIGIELSQDIWLLVSVAVIGGFAGGLTGSKLMANKSLRYLLAFVLVLASIKLFVV